MNQQEIENYSKKLFEDGFVHIKSFLKGDEIKDLVTAIDIIKTNPTPLRILKKDAEGEFFMDFNNWRRSKEVEKICKMPKIVDLVTKLTGSKKCWLMHEDVIVKSGKGAPTPVHHDRPYFIAKGDLNLSVWMTPEDVAANSSLICFKGTHKIKKLFLPKIFKTGENAVNYPRKNKEEFEEITQNTFKDNEQVDFDLKAGDAIVFFHTTVHSSHTHRSQNTRRSLVVRYMLDGASLTKKFFNDVPPYEIMGVKIEEDAPIPEKFFPLLKG